MKEKRILQLMLILGFSVFCRGNSALALQLVSSYPPGDAWIEHNVTNPCTYTYYTIDTADYRDFNNEEKIDNLNLFLSLYGSHVDVPTPSLSSTWTYNCHGRIFIDENGWLNSVSGFEGCTHEENENGAVYRFTGHSATEGYGDTYIYYGKCGEGPLAYHDDDQPYGAHYERWCELE